PTNSPFPAVEVLRSAPVSDRTTVTETPATGDPVASATRPRIVPEVACPHATQTDASRATITSAMRLGDPPFMSGISSQAVILPQAILIHHRVRSSVPNVPNDRPTCYGKPSSIRIRALYSPRRQSTRRCTESPDASVV